MSTEPSPSGPDQQEPVDVAPEAEATPRGDATDGSEEPSGPEQAATEQAATEQAASKQPATEQAATEQPAAAEQVPPATEGPAVDGEAPGTGQTGDVALAAAGGGRAAAPRTSTPGAGTPEADGPPPQPAQADAPTPTLQEPTAEGGAAAADTAAPPRPRPGQLPSVPAHDAPRPSDVMPARAHAPAPAAVLTPPLAVGAASFGRVDEAGVVHVRDGDAEREVGQYPDVPPAEALAFYVRKFEDLAAQVHLLGQRLDNGTVPAKEARASLLTLRASATEAKAVGDLPTLRAELDRLDGLVAERTRAEDAQRAAARAQALAEREAIVVEAEQIAATPAQTMHFKNAGERMQALLDAWKAAQRSGTRLDKRSEDPLWKRFAAARSTVDRMRRAHFAQVSDQRSGTRSTKEQLIARAEELQTSTDWRSASDEYRSLMDRWKSAGRLSRKDDDALWARFRAAQDVFFAARTAANSAQDDEYKANLGVKEALLLEAEALLPVTDLDRARKALSSIQDRWDDAGRVPRGDLDRIEGRLRVVIEKVRDADSAKWGKGTPEVVARGSGLVLQLRQQVADLDTKIAEAEARGDTRTASRSAKERATKQAWLDQAEASLDDISR